MLFSNTTVSSSLVIFLSPVHTYSDFIRVGHEVALLLDTNRHWMGVNGSFTTDHSENLTTNEMHLL